jgi:hypothetical protein
VVGWYSGQHTERRANDPETEVDAEALTEDGSGERLLVSAASRAVRRWSDEPDEDACLLREGASLSRSKACDARVKGGALCRPSGVG